MKALELYIKFDLLYQLFHHLKNQNWLVLQIKSHFYYFYVTCFVVKLRGYINSDIMKIKKIYSAVGGNLRSIGFTAIQTR